MEQTIPYENDNNERNANGQTLIGLNLIKLQCVPVKTLE